MTFLYDFTLGLTIGLGYVIDVLTSYSTIFKIHHGGKIYWLWKQVYYRKKYQTSTSYNQAITTKNVHRKDFFFITYNWVLT